MIKIKFILFSLIVFFNSINCIYSQNINNSQNAPITTISSAVACPNTIITLYVTATNVVLIKNVNFEFDYDGAVLSYVNPNPNLLPGNYHNTNPVMYSNGGDFSATQSVYTYLIGYKKVRPYWTIPFYSSVAVIPLTVNNVAQLFDLTFRYYGGSTIVSFNNSAIYGGGPTGQVCEWGDSLGYPYIDTPTVNFYINGTVTQAPPPAQPSIITGYTQPVVTDTTVYSVANTTGLSYTWSAPSAWVGASNVNSISYIVGSNSGAISVSATNSCGTGPPRTLNVTPITGHTIKGYLTYDNIAETPLDSAWMYLKQNGNILDSCQTNLNGRYQFNVTNNGAYNIGAKTKKAWGGVNITDVVKIKRHFSGAEPLHSSIRLHAGDVNSSFIVNITSAVSVSRRYSGADTLFERGDWVFEKPYGGDTVNVSTNMNDTVIVNGANVVQNFKGLCVGDVNGSYNSIPIGNKSLMINSSRKQQQEAVIRSEKIKVK